MWKSIPDATASTGRRTAPTLVRFLVPLAIAGVLVLLHRPVMALVVAGIGIALGVVGLASPRASRAIEAAGAWLGRVVGGALAFVLLGVVFFGVFSVVSLVLRLLGRDPLARRPEASRTSYWGPAPSRDKPLYRWQFALEPRDTGSRRSRPVLGFLAVLGTLLVLNLVAGIALRAAHLAEPTASDPRSRAAAYAGVDWAKPYYAEYARSSTQRYAGFMGWRRRDFRGEYINVENGIRRTYATSLRSEGKRPVRVFFFGGSTMWGLGSRDAHTIPSEFVRLAEADGVPVEATNYGEVAYVSWQEVMLLAEQCAKGNVPDLAIFYDGVNDVFVQLQQPTAEPLPQNFASLRGRFEGGHDLGAALRANSGVHILLGRLRGTGTGTRPYRVEDLPAPVEVLAKNADGIYRQSVEHAQRLARAYEFDVSAFWQPCVYTKAPVADGERPMLEELGPGMGALYRAATAGVDGAADHLTTALDAARGPVMVDWCHTNEAGARAVAEAIYARVRDRVRALGAEDGAS